MDSSVVCNKLNGGEMDTIGRNNVMAETSQTNALNTRSSMEDDSLPMMEESQLAEEIKTIQEEEEAVQQAKKSFLAKKYEERTGQRKAHEDRVLKKAVQQAKKSTKSEATKQRGLLTDATEALGGSTADELATVPTYELGSAVEASHDSEPEAEPGETHLAVVGPIDVPSVMDRRYIRDKLYKADVKPTAPTRTRTRTPSPASSGSSSTYSNIVQEDQVKDSSEDPSRPGKRFKKSGSS